MRLLGRLLEDVTVVGGLSMSGLSWNTIPCAIERMEGARTVLVIGVSEYGRVTASGSGQTASQNDFYIASHTCGA